MPTSALQIAATPRGKVSYTDTGSGSVRVLLHSLLTDRTAFDSVTGLLGGRVITLDLPGFGESEPATPLVDDFALRVGAFIDATGLDRVDLIGNGFGAFVAFGTAIHHPHLVRRLVLVGCGAVFPEPAQETFLGMADAVESGGMEAVIPVALRRIFTEEYIEEHPEMAEERAAILRKTDPEAFITACLALNLLDHRALASSVTAPTLIVVGEEDQATPPAMAEELHGLIEGSSLVVMPGLAHAPQIQAPDEFAAAVRPFLEGQ